MNEKQPQPHEDDPSETEKERRRKDSPRVWVGSLADYNNGHLHGKWIDAAVPDHELAAAVQRMLATSKEPLAEEHGIFDYDNFGAYRVGEYDDLAHVARVARGISEHGPAFGTWAQLHDGDPAMLDEFEDSFLGEYESTEAWAHDFLDAFGLDQRLAMADFPETLRGYIQIDYAGWARDAEISGDLHLEPAPGGGIYVFLAR